MARHTGQLIDDLPYVQILDTPVPQMVDSAMDFFRRLDLPVAVDGGTVGGSADDLILFFIAADYGTAR